MKVFDVRACRLGNAIFRYLAISLFCILFEATRTYDENELTHFFNNCII